MQHKILLCFVALFCWAYAQDTITSGESEDAPTTNPDYAYPCGTTPDMACVKEYFVNSGQCTPVPDLEEGSTITRRRQPVHLSYINTTVVTHYGEIKYEGVECEKFYINNRTRNLILALSFRKISLYAENSEFIIHRRGQEALETIDFVNITYTGTITAVIPVFRFIMMKAAATSAYITDSHPFFELGPNFSASSNQVIAFTYSELVKDIPTAVQEIFLTDASSYFFCYFENYICSFGVPYST